MAKFDVSNAKGLEELNKHLETRSYIDGYVPSQNDVAVFKSFSAAPDAKYVNVSRWYNHIAFFPDAERNSWGGAAAAATPAAASSAAPAKSEDDFDLFGDDDDKYDEAYEAEVERRAKEQAEKKAKSGKVVVLKSAVVIDVKPWESDTDMKAMEEGVRAIQMEGLEWKAAKLVDIGYGIKKLQISCHIVDNVVSVDDIQERIQEDLADLVQSTDIVTFTKL